MENNKYVQFFTIFSFAGLVGLIIHILLSFLTYKIVGDTYCWNTSLTDMNITQILHCNDIEFRAALTNSFLTSGFIALILVIFVTKKYKI